MTLTPAQLTALKADIAANTNTIVIGGVPTAIKDIPDTADNNFAIAQWYGQTAVPNFTVWKKLVSISEVGDNINGAELGGLTTANNTRLQTVVVLSSGGINPSLPDRRAFFDDIFSGAGGTTTRAQLLALWKRLASYVQKLFSTGTGSDASPATTATNISDGFQLSYLDVQAARRLP